MGKLVWQGLWQRRGLSPSASMHMPGKSTKEVSFPRNAVAQNLNWTIASSLWAMTRQDRLHTGSCVTVGIQIGASMATCIWRWGRTSAVLRMKRRLYTRHLLKHLRRQPVWWSRCVSPGEDEDFYGLSN